MICIGNFPLSVTYIKVHIIMKKFEGLFFTVLTNILFHLVMHLSILLLSDF